MPLRDPAYRIYFRRTIVVALAYLATTMLAVRLIDETAPPTALTYAIALLPALVIVGWIWVLGRLFVELDDEYLRMLEIRKAIVATGFLLIVCTIWGTFEMFGLSRGFPSFFAFPVWCLGLVPGQFANRLMK